MKKQRRQRPIDTGGIIPHAGLRRLYRPFQPLVEGAFGFPALWRLHDACVSPNTDAVCVAERCLAELGVRWNICGAELERLRSIEGPLVVLANHPFGGIDSFALICLLERIRPGAWKMFSNELVAKIEGLKQNSLAVDPLGEKSETARANRASMRAAYTHLKQGGVLAAFAAGRVSHRSKELDAICDQSWSPHLHRLATKAGATCALVHIPGQNSRRFLRVPPKWSRFRALMLCRELTSPTCEKIELRLAALFEPNDLKRLGEGETAADKLRASCFLRADLDTPRPAPAGKQQDTGQSTKDDSGDSAHLPPPATLSEAVRLSAENLVAQNANFDLLFARGANMPAMMHELGRAREITFRHAGQGVGKEVDLSPEDDYYHHLLLWDREQSRLAGAYRVGIVQDILQSRGLSGLYLDHVFEIQQSFYKQLGGAFELSRSFILPEYQRDSGALAGLWKGLGAAADKHRANTLFGSVTISNDHHPASRAILVEHLKRNYADDESLRSLVRARRAFEPSTRYHPLVAEAYEGESIDSLAPVIDRIEEGARGIPPLMRYYCTLGARFLDYHVEAAFQDALYCLLRVQLDKIPAAYKKRFLGIKPETEEGPRPRVP